MSPRWLILGASGWFGRTALALVGRRDALPIGGPTGCFPEWDWNRVKDFRPTHIVNCAFLTKEKLEPIGEGAYVRINSELISRFEAALGLSSCRVAVTISSGSIMADPTHPYSVLKRKEEVALLNGVSPNIGAVALRAFSVSGPYVQRVSDYAWSDLIRQALEQRTDAFQFRSAGQVWRRYVCVEDALTVAIGCAEQRMQTVIETGGPLIELRDLGVEINATLGTNLKVSQYADETSDLYFSDDVTWQSACSAAGVTPKSLRRQILHTVAGCSL